MHRVELFPAQEKTRRKEPVPLTTEKKESMLLRFLDWLYNERQIVFARQTESGLVNVWDQRFQASQLAQEFLKRERNTEEV